MRNLLIPGFVFFITLGFSNQHAWGVDATVEAEVNVNADLNIGLFYEKLAPHGQWVEIETYGWVWQPAVVVTDETWRPYCNEGHWVYTDAGWYWESSYPWAWAAFHYGRWSYHEKYKWVWLPDVTWGPAWVTWRRSDDVYGWAPLPFGARFEAGAFAGASLDLKADLFTFVPAQSFLSIHVGSAALPREKVTTVFNKTKVVNNTYVYNNNRVVNNGIPKEEVAATTKQEIKTATIADAKSPGQKGESDGKIAAFRPALKNEKPKNPPPTSKAAKTGDEGSDPKKASQQSKTGTENVPAGHVTREPLPETKTQDSARKTEVKTPEAKSVEKTIDRQTNERVPEPDPKDVVPPPTPTGKAPEAKTNDKTMTPNSKEKAAEPRQDEKAPKAGSHERPSEEKTGMKSPENKTDEKKEKTKSEGERGRE